MYTPIERSTTRQAFGRALFETLAFSGRWIPEASAPLPPAGPRTSPPGPGGQERDGRGYQRQRTSGR
ncbi:hypothetical protein [Streptomyces sp. NBC_01264]|uniref:hypothetical protein n=1 Tax=Streptomyces sp. NBC_01264 TaxID=2903804 RepID=UPI0022509286|nr:hypothetical protein [Streptomyces sp. NBC_01264]MCX4781715.1 hypothetical protein [Streptomyces sp. NBC_01264]